MRGGTTCCDVGCCCCCCCEFRFAVVVALADSVDLKWWKRLGDSSAVGEGDERGSSDRGFGCPNNFL